MILSISENITVNLKQVTVIKRGENNQAEVFVKGEKFLSSMDYDGLLNLINIKEDLRHRGNNEELATLIGRAVPQGQMTEL